MAHHSETLSLHAGGLPVTRGRLMDFPADPIACLRKLHSAHGEIAALEEDGQRLYFIFSPELNHRVLSDGQTFHSQFFAIRGNRNSSQRRLTSGLLSMNGEQHKRNRRLVMDAFTRKAIQLYIPAIRRLTEEMLAEWDVDQTRDISKDMTEFMLRLTSTILFGLDRRELACHIGQMIDHWIHMNHSLGMGAFVSRPEITAEYENLLTYARQLEAELVGLINLRRQPGSHTSGTIAPAAASIASAAAAAGCPFHRSQSAPTSASPAVTSGSDALSLLLAAHDDQGSINDDELVGQTALLFAASHLTTAHTLAWTLFLLTQHPQVTAAISHELSSNLHGDAPNSEDLDRLPILDRVIKESMRVLPASSYSQRVTSCPTTLGPFSLPAGAGIIFSQFMTHHRGDLYSQPDSFQPDRWQKLSPSPYAYLPFGAGPRMCIGAPLAMLILKTVLPMILQKFRLHAVAHSEVHGSVISTMLCPTAPIWMKLSQPNAAPTAQPVAGNIHQLVDLPQRSSGQVRRAA